MCLEKIVLTHGEHAVAKNSGYAMKTRSVDYCDHTDSRTLNQIHVANFIWFVYLVHVVLEKIS